MSFQWEKLGFCLKERKWPPLFIGWKNNFYFCNSSSTDRPDIFVNVFFSSSLDSPRASLFRVFLLVRAGRECIVSANSSNWHFIGRKNKFYYYDSSSTELPGYFRWRFLEDFSDTLLASLFRVSLLKAAETKILSPFIHRFFQFHGIFNGQRKTSNRSPPRFRSWHWIKKRPSRIPREKRCFQTSKDVGSSFCRSWINSIPPRLCSSVAEDEQKVAPD